MRGNLKTGNLHFIRLEQFVLVLFILFFVSSVGSIGLGDGSDGSKTVSNTDVVVNSYTFLNNDELSGQDTISVANGGIFSSGDVALIIQMQSGSNGAAGEYEYRRVSSSSSAEVIFDNNLKNSYYSGGSGSDTITQVIRVPEYTSLTVSGSITAPQWDGTKGGIVAVLVDGNLNIDSGGSFDVSGKGFRGGSEVGGNGYGYQGESYTGKGSKDNVANGGGGGGGCCSSDSGEGGAGGGYLNSGGTDADAEGGKAYERGFKILPGSGGGGGEGERDDCGTAYGGDGGDGGGAISIRANDITVDGAIYANGEQGKPGGPDGQYYCNTDSGGGGSGGGVFIATTTGYSSSSSIVVDGGSDGDESDNDDQLGGGSVGVRKFKALDLSSTSNKEAPPGSLWIEGKNLHWADGSMEYWSWNPELVNSNSDGNAGALWIEGKSLHWIDEFGDERKYEGVLLSSNSGVQVGRLWLENGNIHYIDALGDERKI